MERKKRKLEQSVDGLISESGQGRNAGTGRWIATDALTGIPLDSNPRIYSEVQDDLLNALRHRVDDFLHRKGQTLFRSFGQVTVTYTVVERISDQGSGCTFRTQYVSHGGTIVWIHTIYHKRTMRHTLTDTFTIWPP